MRMMHGRYASKESNAIRMSKERSEMRMMHGRYASKESNAIRMSKERSELRMMHGRFGSVRCGNELRPVADQQEFQKLVTF